MRRSPHVERRRVAHVGAKPRPGTSAGAASRHGAKWKRQAAGERGRRQRLGEWRARSTTPVARACAADSYACSGVCIGRRPSPTRDGSAHSSIRAAESSRVMELKYAVIL
ncbi:hypothetical protein AB1Y20_022300 [Prymnesium parvum]|uniref:Uncharacterized protein n=1 Tax=Prymnesium parvum TaxID=97485 RepID=A0AB34JIY2_PRYPA